MEIVFQWQQCLWYFFHQRWGLCFLLNLCGLVIILVESTQRKWNYITTKARSWKKGTSQPTCRAMHSGALRQHIRDSITLRPPFCEPLCGVAICSLSSWQIQLKLPASSQHQLPGSWMGHAGCPAKSSLNNQQLDPSQTLGL